jgi:hypothetical protein
MELLSMPSTSQGKQNASAILISTENIDDDDDEEADSFTTQKLFSFAWQIAKGMVGINIAISKSDKIRYFSVVTLDLRNKRFLSESSES